MCTCSCRPVFAYCTYMYEYKQCFFLDVKIRTTRRVLHPTSETVRVQDAAVLSYTGKHFFHTYSSTDCIVESVTEVSLQLACRKEKRKNTRLSCVKKILRSTAVPQKYTCTATRGTEGEHSHKKWALKKRFFIKNWKKRFIKSWKTSAVSTTVWMVETQLCKLRGTSDTFV